MAAQYGHRAIVELLLERDPSQINGDKFRVGDTRRPIFFSASSPISCAALFDQCDIILLLAANGAAIPSHLKSLQRSLNELFVRSARSEFSTLSAVRLTSRREVKVTISDMFRMAAAQKAQETVQTMLDNHREHLEDNDFTQALVGAATAGNL